MRSSFKMYMIQLWHLLCNTQFHLLWSFCLLFPTTYPTIITLPYHPPHIIIGTQCYDSNVSITTLYSCYEIHCHRKLLNAIFSKLLEQHQTPAYVYPFAMHENTTNDNIIFIFILTPSRGVGGIQTLYVSLISLTQNCCK